MSKIKVSFEITDNWIRVDFRGWIKYLLSLEQDYEVYIISNDDSALYINRVANDLGLDANHTKICNFTDDKLQTIVVNNINIHFDNLESFTVLVDTTDTYGILVRGNLNRFHLKSQYVLDFENTVKLINREKNEQA